MKEKSINYYGYEKASYLDCLELIANMNRKHIEILNVWFIIVAAVYLYLSWRNLFGFNSRDAIRMLVFVVTGIVFEGLILFKRYFTNRWERIAMHISMAAMLGFGIVCSAAQPFMAATLFLVLLVLIAMSYITSMADMLAVMLIGCGIFLYVSYKVKPASIFNQDLFNVILVLQLSIVLHYTFQRAHIRQFITFRQRTKMQQELEIKSSFDALTSLLNRGRFFSMAGEVLRHDNDDFIVLGLMDLDKFKQINDTLGHQMGDKVIQTAGKTILEALDINYDEKWSFPERAVKDNLSFAGRLGGDEFVVMIRNLKNEEEMAEAFETMLRTLNEVRLEGLNGINASIGVTKITPEDRDIDKAYARADEALYRSKEAGRNRISVHE
ncbi:MAG: GGDEF domain-containing protein [Lachnospiraceae bacterium]|nr:GGDEF domain-containing protein [Lachnospiraceae bacterium]